ncbi:MAG: hypothetical protein ABW033_03565 [Acidimicrobiia bacterium]
MDSFDVVVADLDEDRARATADEVEALGVRALGTDPVAARRSLAARLTTAEDGYDASTRRTEIR